MNKIKLVLADLDGTVVLPESQHASEAVVSAILLSEQEGATFTAVTGRTFPMALSLLQAIGINGPCIFEGGAIIINPISEEVLWSKTVSAETTRLAVERLIKHASKIEWGAGAMKPDDIDLTSITKPALSIWASIPTEMTDEVISDLSSLPGIAVHGNIGPGGDMTRTGIQVTHKEADKEHAVRALLEIVNIDQEHTLAIGDGNNDLPLFKNAGVKVAMGNASDRLKSESDHVVASVNDDGFAEAILKFVIPRPDENS